MTIISNEAQVTNSQKLVSVPFTEDELEAVILAVHRTFEMGRTRMQNHFAEMRAAGTIIPKELQDESTRIAFTFEGALASLNKAKQSHYFPEPVVGPVKE